MNEHVQVLRGSSILIHRITTILDENSISTIIKDNAESARLAGFGSLQNEVELYVYNSDLKSALKIIEEFKIENNH